MLILTPIIIVVVGLLLACYFTAPDILTVMEESE